MRLVDGHEFATAAAGVDRAAARRPHPRQLGAVGHQARRRGRHAATSRSSSCSASARRTSRSPTTTWSELDRAVERRPPDVRVRPARSARRSAPATCASTSSPARCASSARGTSSRPTPASCRYLVEETFELVDALDALDPDDPATDEALIEELGDLLYQIEFHATIAEQEGRFSIADVTARHPRQARAPPPARVRRRRRRRRRARCVANWDDIKRDEKGRTSVFDGVARVAAGAGLRPARCSARRPRSASTGPTSTAPLAKVDEELGRAARGDRRRRRSERIADELGDLVFAVVNVARHLDVDAELAAARRGRQVPPPLRGGRGARRRARHRPARRRPDDARRPVGRGQGRPSLSARQTDGRCGCSSPIRRTTRTSGRCRSPPTSPTGTCRTCTACSACTATSCGSSSSATDGDRTSYVVKELPDHLAQREYRLLRGLAEDRLPDGHRRRRRHRPHRRPRRPARHPPPRLLAAVPHAAVRARADDPVPRRPPARRPRRPARAAPPRRVLLGRLLAVEHAVPPRRRRAAGVHHRRRDERALRPS